MEVTWMKLQDSLAAHSSPPLCTPSRLEHWNPGEWCTDSITPSSPGDKPRNVTRSMRECPPGAGEQHHPSPDLTHERILSQHCSATPKNCKKLTLRNEVMLMLVDFGCQHKGEEQLTSHTHHWAIYRPQWTSPSPINPQMSILPTLNTDWFSTRTSARVTFVLTTHQFR